jgi:hypothetical protein
MRAAPGALLAGQQAEAAMRDQLLRGLPAGWWVLSGLVLPGLRGDIDLLVVGGLGAVVLEVKYWAGRIICGAGGHTWARERRGLIESLDDPAGQLEGEIRALHVFLQPRAAHSIDCAMTTRRSWPSRGGPGHDASRAVQQHREHLPARCAGRSGLDREGTKTMTADASVDHDEN